MGKKHGTKGEEKAAKKAKTEGGDITSAKKQQVEISCATVACTRMRNQFTLQVAHIVSYAMAE